MPRRNLYPNRNRSAAAVSLADNHTATKKEPMRSNNPVTILCAAALMIATEFVRAQDSPTPSPGPATSFLFPPPPPPGARPSVADLLTRTLSLTDTQKIQLQTYFNAVQSQLDIIHQQAHQAEDALIQQLLTQIRPCLTSEQQAKVDALQQLAGPLSPPEPVVSN